jgi:hypothetical protein
MLSQAPIAALLSLLGVMLGAGLQYYFGRTLESRKQLAVQRSQAYVDYFKAVALLAQHGPAKDSLALAADAKVRVCIYGSSAVIKCMSDFEAAGPSITTPASASAIVSLLVEMRKDTGMWDRLIGREEFQSILISPHLRSSG